jgi:two-component system KDP operon response regulator KdpE
VTRVLLVDDEPDVRHSVGRSLQVMGYELDVAANGAEGLEMVETRHPDVVLLDLAMPTMSGLSALERLRTWSKVPIIVLSVMGEEDDKVRALEAGADDYLTKPFGMQELNARIRLALRHARPEPAPSVWQSGAIRIDIDRRSVRIDGEDVHLTPIEYEVLKQLVLDAGRVLTHRVLLARVWGPAYADETHYLRPIITSLRKKLGPQLIRTEPGVGYRLQPSADT